MVLTNWYAIGSFYCVCWNKEKCHNIHKKIKKIQVILSTFKKSNHFNWFCSLYLSLSFFSPNDWATFRLTHRSSWKWVKKTSNCFTVILAVILYAGDHNGIMVNKSVCCAHFSLRLRHRTSAQLVNQNANKKEKRHIKTQQRHDVTNKQKWVRFLTCIEKFFILPNIRSDHLAMWFHCWCFYEYNLTLSFP